MLAVGLATYAGHVVNLSPQGIKSVAIAAIFLVAIVNIRGVRLGAWFVRGLMFLRSDCWFLSSCGPLFFNSATGPISRPLSIAAQVRRR